MDSTLRVVDLTDRFDLARSMTLAEDASIDLISDYLKKYEDDGDS